MLNAFSTALELLAAYRAGSASVREVVELYRRRNDELHSKINAVITPNYDQALDQARFLDELNRAGADSLGGLPVTVKDAIHVAGLPTTGGITEPARSLASDDAPNVHRLRAAGALFLGKTNLPTGGGDWQTDNPLFGRTNNPWNPALTPGGSSGGGAAAVCAGLTAADLGSDIGGSIRIPAAFCGVFGHKPSATALPRSGHFPRGNLPNPAQLLAVQGPLARGARDLTLLTDAAAGPDGLEGKGWRLELPPARFEALSACRVGVLKLPEWIPVEDSIMGALQKTMQALREHGAAVLEADLSGHFADFGVYYRQYLMLMQCIVGAGLPAATRTRTAEKMRACRDPFRAAIADGLEAGAGSLLELIEVTESYKRRWETIFQDFDVLLSPVCNVNAFAHDDSYFYDRELDVSGVKMPYYQLSALPAIASLAGLPATAFPTGQLSENNAPIGLQVMGAYLEDRSTLCFAELIEQAMGGFKAPPGFD